ncbi:MAG: aspartate--tRNA ligase [Clostridiales bacterium]|nr:aspartate--tRNA ligase [Clostridiales bacterium]
MGELLQDWKRTFMCAEIEKKDLNKQVTLMGWVQRRRDLGKLIFVWLRDRSGIVQVVFDAAQNQELFDKASQIRSEFVIAVKGTVIVREVSNINPSLKTGEIEVAVSELKLLSGAATPPFAIDDDVNANDTLRYTYRYLDLRRAKLQNILTMRSSAAIETRNYMNENGFLEIETPVLTKSTPEGARDYLVPSRVHNGSFYALPQSPQLFKQLLMVSGFDRYFQIVKCFRDEDLRADRQPEFTQIDLEMSFVEQEDVMAVGEGLLRRVFKKIVNYDIPSPIQRMTWREAMDQYGSDKPDLRFGLTIQNVSGTVAGCGFSVFASAVANGGSVRGINAKGLGSRLSRKEIDALGEVVKTYRAKGLAWVNITDEGIKSSFAKFMSEQELQALIEAMHGEKGDALFFVADRDQVALEALGQLRLELSRKFSLADPNEYRFVWITEFPMFEYSEEDGRYYAMHHPFTAPMDEDLPLLGKDNGRVRAKAYDIVLNGYELGGGSIRIHSEEIQTEIFKELGFNEEEIQRRFGFLVNAFKYGAPPHGGMAIGFDRLIMLLCKTDNIKDVIAFPKMQNACCLMTEAPNTVDEKQLQELGIEIVRRKE